MKRIIMPALAAAVILSAASCSDDSLMEPISGGSGRVLLRGASDLRIEAPDTRAEFDLSTIGVTTPAPGEFSLTLTSPEMEVKSVWSNIDLFNAADTLFKAGNYTADISYGNPDEEGINKPYYKGAKQVKVIATQTVHEDIPATIANSLAEVRTTEAFNNYFHDARFTLKTASGNSFEFTPGDPESVIPVFVKAGTQLTVSGTAYRQSPTGEGEGPQVRFAEQTLHVTSARTRHIFTFDAADAGSASLQITLYENQTITLAVEVELNTNA